MKPPQTKRPDPKPTAVIIFSLLLYGFAGPATAGSSPAVYFAAGDIAKCAGLKPGPGAVATAGLLDRLVMEEPGAVILALGDLAYGTGAAQQFAACYEPTWGRHRERTWPVPGNHEYYANETLGKGYNIEPYNQYWQTRFATAGISGQPALGFYAFDTARWRIIAVNSEVYVRNVLLAGDYYLDRLQSIRNPIQRQRKRQELEKQLDAARALYDATAREQDAWLQGEAFNENMTCTLVFMHHPRFSSGYHGNAPEETTPLLPLYRVLYEHNVDLVLAGHDHHYERLQPMDAGGRPDPDRGIRNFVVGTGGAQLRTFEALHPHSEARNNKQWGVLKLELFENSYSWQFIPVTGSPAKKHTASCTPKS